MSEIPSLGAHVLRVPQANELPQLCARVARLWAEIYTASPALALDLAAKLPTMQITEAPNARSPR